MVTFRQIVCSACFTAAARRVAMSACQTAGLAASPIVRSQRLRRQQSVTWTMSPFGRSSTLGQGWLLMAGTGLPALAQAWTALKPRLAGVRR